MFIKQPVESSSTISVLSSFPTILPKVTRDRFLLFCKEKVLIQIIFSSQAWVPELPLWNLFLCVAFLDLGFRTESSLGILSNMRQGSESSGLSPTDCIFTFFWRGHKMKCAYVPDYNGIYVHHVRHERFGYLSFNSYGTHLDSRPAVYSHHWLAQCEIKQTLPLNRGESGSTGEDIIWWRLPQALKQNFVSWGM